MRAPGAGGVQHAGAASGVGGREGYPVSCVAGSMAGQTPCSQRVGGRGRRRTCLEHDGRVLRREELEAQAAVALLPARALGVGRGLGRSTGAGRTAAEAHAAEQGAPREAAATQRLGTQPGDVKTWLE